MQMSLVSPETDWSPPEFLPSLAAAKLIAVDLETSDPHLLTHGSGWATGDGFIAGVAIATDDGFQGYFPIAHANGGNLDRDMVLAWLREELSRKTQAKVFANAQYDVGWLLREEVAIAGALYDVQVAEPLLDENRQTYRLDALAQDYLGRRKNEKLLREAAKSWGVDPKSGIAQMPACFVGPYAEDDAGLTLRIFQLQEIRLREADLWALFQLETSLTPALLAMRSRGVRVNVNEAVKLRDKWLSDEQEMLKEIKSRWREIDPWNGTMIARAFDLENLPYPRSATGKPSFQSAWLAAHPHSLAQMIYAVRKINKARSTFLEGHILSHARNGRVHCEFHPLRSDAGGTITGRMSSSNPNLQQIPSRDPDIGHAIRSLFLPEKGTSWLSMDYSQQEPRLTVHYAATMGLRGADEAEAYYKNDPDADYHRMVAEMAGIPRSQAKQINLGLAYGMGKKKLAETLGLTDADAEALFQQYHERVPFVRELTQRATRRATDIGVIRTLLGRQCRFPHWEPTDFSLAQARWADPELRRPMSRAMAEAAWPGKPLRRSFTHTAMNKLIQGSAADMTKKAMSDLWSAGILPHLQIHDELCFSMESTKHAEAISEIMRNCIALRVPIRVDGKAGNNWGEIG